MIEIRATDVERISSWLRDRGGVAVWRLLTAPGTSLTPARTETGEPMPKPSWRHADAPERIVTSAAEVQVITPERVTSFPVSNRRGDALQFVLTDGSQRKLDRALAEAGEGAWYEFEYDECVIFKPGSVTTLDNLSRRFPREEVLRAAREGDFSSLPRDGTHVVKP